MRARTTHAVDSSPAVRYPRFAGRTTDTDLGPERGEPGVVQLAGPAESGGLGLIDVHWRVANYLSVRQAHLMDNPLLPEPLRPEHIKPRLLSLGHHAGAEPVHGHLNCVMPTAHWAGLAALRPNGQQRVSATSLANSNELLLALLLHDLGDMPSTSSSPPPGPARPPERRGPPAKRRDDQPAHPQLRPGRNGRTSCSRSSSPAPEPESPRRCPATTAFPPRGMEVLAITRGGAGWRATCSAGDMAARLLRGAHTWSDSVLDQHAK